MARHIGTLSGDSPPLRHPRPSSTTPSSEETRESSTTPSSRDSSTASNAKNKHQRHQHPNHEMHIPPPKAWNIDIDTYLDPLIPRSRLHRLPTPISHWLGYRAKPNQPLGNLIVAFWSLLGGFTGIIVLSAFFMSPFIRDRGGPVIVGSFGAMAVLEYGAIESPFSQPRNALCGQFLAALIGVCVTKLFMLAPDWAQIEWVAGALAVGVTSAVMALTKTIHPPAGATALLAATQPAVSGLGWWYLPVILTGSLLTTATACLINNLQRQFPLYWWTPRTGASTAEVKQKEQQDAEKARGREQEVTGSRKREHGEGRGTVVHDVEGEVLISFEAIHLPATLFLSTEEKKMLEILQERLGAVEREGRISESTLAGSEDRT